MIDVLIVIGLAVFALWLIAIDQARRDANEDERQHFEDNKE